MVGTLVVGLPVGFLDPLQITVGDAADVADGVRTDGSEGILAKEPGPDLDTGKAVALGGEDRHFGVGQTGADRHRLEILGLVEQALEALAVLGLDVDQLGQSVDRRVEVSGQRGRDFQRIRRVVARQNDAVAVGDHPAVGNDGDERDAVVFGAGAVEVVLQDLQPDEAPDQRAEGEEHDERGNPEPETEAVEVALGVVKVAHGPEFRQIGRSGFCSTGWYCGRSRTKVSGTQSRLATTGPMK